MTDLAEMLRGYVDEGATEVAFDEVLLRGSPAGLATRRRGSQRRFGLRFVLVTAVVAVVLVGVGLLIALGPRSSPPGKKIVPGQKGIPSVVVIPSWGLQDGEVVTVHVKGLPHGVKFFVSECLTKADASNSGCGPQVAQQPFGITDDTGTGSIAFTVHSSAAAKVNSQVLAPCTGECVVVARPDVSGASFEFAPIAFAPPTPSTTTTTSATTTNTTPNQALPPLDFETLPVPSDYTCSPGLSFSAPANQASGLCIPYAYVLGGPSSDPNDNTACPAGSFMSMGPVECDNGNGIVTPVPPGPNTCSNPGGPCPSSTLPLSSEASVLPWSAIDLPTGTCPAGYYFGETNGTATCVPYGYLPGGTSANPNDNTACPAGSGLDILKLTGTLCTQDAEPYEIVAPVPGKS